MKTPYIDKKYMVMHLFKLLVSILFQELFSFHAEM